MRIGIIGASEIAFRRFLPSLKGIPELTYAGVASRNTDKAKNFLDTFGGKIYSTYESLINDPEIDAVYLPLPPSLHAEWGEKVLLSGKHLLMEKPFTTTLDETSRLISLARERNLALHENYMFLYHSQLAKIKEIIASGELGDIRLIRMEFGFPHRDANDFRYNKALGGGALLDCGGYPIRLASELLGDTARVTHAALNVPAGSEVDICGFATMENDGGLTAQLAFGMDNTYRCSLNVWGSKQELHASRIFTSPPDFVPPVTVSQRTASVSADDAFKNSILRFIKSINSPSARNEMYENIYNQSKLVDEVISLNTNKRRTI